MIGADTVSDFRQVCDRHTGAFEDLRQMRDEIRDVVESHADTFRDLYKMYGELGEHPNDVIRYTTLGLLGVVAVSYAIAKGVTIVAEDRRDRMAFKNSVRRTIASL